MSTEYWVIKFTDRDGNGYIFEDKKDGIWCYSSIRSDTTKFKDLKSCRAEIVRFKASNPENWDFAFNGQFPKIRPVKVKVKTVKKKPDNLPPIHSLWENEGYAFVVKAYYSEDIGEWQVGYIEYDSIHSTTFSEYFEVNYNDWVDWAKLSETKMIGVVNPV